MNVTRGDDPARILATTADVWADILAVESVSADDDFFKLGGDSLAATTMAARLEEQLGVGVDPARVFQHPRLKDFVRAVADALGEDIEEGVL